MVRISYEGDTVELESGRELLAALELTPPEVDEQLLSQIGEKITEIVKTEEEFLLLLQKAIDTKGRSKLPYLQCFGDRLNLVVNDGKTLSKALALLANESDQEYFLNQLGRENLRNCIANVVDIAESLEWLYGKMDTLFIDLIGWDFLMKFVNSGNCLGLLVKCLSNEEEKQLLEKMGWKKVMACIQSPQDLMFAFIGLGGEGDRLLIEKLVEFDKLKHVIPSQQELDKICKRGLDYADETYLREKYAAAVSQ